MTGLWITIPAARLTIRLHLLLPVAAGLLWAVRPGLAVRYLLLLAILVVHELGHALASLCVGGRKTVVSISPVFGWAAVESFPDRRAALVAAAGPAANLLAAAGLWLAGARLDFGLGHAALPDFALTVNLVMGVGNLVPLPPTDGGRILRALHGRAKDAQDKAKEP